MKYTKPFFILLALLCLKKIVRGQVIDSCIIKCRYTFSFQTDSNNVLSVGTDLMVLEMGKNHSIYYSEYRKKGDSLIEEDNKRGLAFADMMTNGQKYYRNKISTIITKNTIANKLTVTETLMEPYTYSEQLSSQDWKILNDTAMLYGLHCQKATAHFRGRDYIAWFTKNVAVQNGPWKFYGLPGLIVKVNDTKLQFAFELAGIEILNKKQAMIIAEKTYIKTTRTAFWKLKKQMADDPIGFSENLSSVKVTPVSPLSPQERRSRSKPFNPLELE